ncbi:hypothetical protein Dcar01_02307 [Deinococcus carri]|uniref:Peripheral subunit-binding (PSBD) domain-containing protein n=1 Tax=Deinococcus carri TaxID=1211323 RepID=A0ABP9W8U9_9DEIO
MERIAPLAKILAEANGIDWRNLQGSGEGGLIVEQDILNYLSRVMSGEEDPPLTPVDAPPPEWTGTDLPAGGGLLAPGMPSMDMLSSAGVDSDLAALVGQPQPIQPQPIQSQPSPAPAAPAPAAAATPPQEDVLEFELEDEQVDTVPLAAQPEAVEVTPVRPAAEAPFVPAAPRLTPQEPARSTETVPGLAAEAQPVTEPVAIPAGAPTPTTPPPATPAAPAAGGVMAGLGSLLSRLYQPAAQPAGQTSSAPAPAEPSAPVVPAPVPSAPQAEVPAVEAPVVEAPVPAAPSAPAAELDEVAPQPPVFAEPEPAPQVAEPLAEPVAEQMPEPALPAQPAPEVARPREAVWFGTYLRRDLTATPATDLRRQLVAALGQDVPLALLVARAAQHHLGALGLDSVAMQDVDAGRARTVQPGSLRDALAALAGDHEGTPDLLVLDAGALDLDDLHLPHTLTLSVGRVQDGRAALSLQGEVDPAQAARFLANVAGTLEEPIILVL